MVKNEPINHVDAKTILGGTDKAVFHIYFYDANQNVCCLEIEITSKRIKSGEFAYAIVNEKLCFEQMENKTFIYLRFKGEEVLRVCWLFFILIENHFNKEIISNRNGITAANRYTLSRGD